MRKLRGSTILSIVGILMAVPTAAQASEVSAFARPAPLNAEAVEHAVRTRAEAEASLSPTAISYYTSTYGVDEAEASQRLATQTMVPNLQYLLAQRLGSSFAQLWFDNSAGQWVVAVTSAASATDVSELLSSVGLGGSFRLDRVDFDQEQMLAALKSLASELAAQIPAGQETVGMGEGQLDVTLAANQQAEVVESDAAQIAAQGLAPPIAIERSSRTSLAGSPEVSCSFPWCNTIVGGDKWYFGKIIKGIEYEFTCSAGFYVGSSGDPHPLILTAGHCAIILGDYTNFGTCDPGTVNCGPYGHQIPYYYYGNGGGDAGLLEDDSFPIYPGYWNWSIGTLSTVEYYYAKGPAPDGLVVCANGAGDGSNCGTIYNNRADNIEYAAEEVGGEVLLPAETFNEMIEVRKGCGAQGNSGGSVTSSTSDTAVATVSGSNGGCGEGARAWVEPLWREIEQFGITIYG